MEDIMLDEAGNFVAAVDGDFQIVSGIRCLAQDVMHRLLGFPGDLWRHPDYGAGLQAYIKSDDNELNRLELQQTIRLGLAQDDRVDQESIDVQIYSWVREKLGLQVSFRPTADAFVREYGYDALEDEAL